MSWTNDAGDHEGYVTEVFADGASSSSWSSEGISVGYGPDGQELPRRQFADVVGWQLRCDHSRWDGPTLPRWEGPLWRRVATPEEDDPTAGRLFASDDDVVWIDDVWIEGPRQDLSAMVMAAWHAHIGPSEAVAALEAAVGTAHRANVELDRAVSSARTAGVSWSAIGAATGMARQSAHQRWSTTGPSS